MNPRSPSKIVPLTPSSAGWWAPALFGGVLVAALLWSYWQALCSVQNRWSADPQYSHGYLVPAFALLVLWFQAVAAHSFFHDLAGWLMMPLAFAALWLELALLRRLFVAVPNAVGPVPLTLPRSNSKRTVATTISRNESTNALTV